MKRLHLLNEADIKAGTRVIVRADLDVGVKNGKIADDFRLRAGLPTLRYLLELGARVRIVGYLGRPQGRQDKKLTLEPIARRLGALLRRKVVFVQDPFNEGTMHKYRQSPEILLFENIRFWPEESQNNVVFARRIARWGDIYVNDAFANSHRSEASLVGLPKILSAYAGLRLTEEIAALQNIMVRPKRPLVAVLGGVKIETKLPFIRKFLRSADRVLVGGALANTILFLSGESIGRSVVDAGRQFTRRRLVKNRKLVVPRDVITARALSSRAKPRLQEVGQIPVDEYILDIGPATRAEFIRELQRAKTIVWNGPLGIAEVPAFAKGTIAVARALQKSKGFTVVGGGDTIAVLNRYKLLKGFGHISTGGGAMLEFLSGKKLPAIEALKR